MKATNIEKYGCEYPAQNEGVKGKMKATNIEKYGCEYPLQNEEVKGKMKFTNIERYDCENPFQNGGVKERIKATNIERYDCEYSAQNKEVKERIKATNIERYGCENPMQNEGTKEKMKTTNIKRYGCEYPMQNSEIFEKNQKSCFKKKEYIFPSGRIDLVQGYEPQALDILIKSYKEDDIITSNSEIESLCGEINYTFEKKKHKYYTDIYIKSTNTFIEVKSEYTFNVKNDQNLKKREACINAGINFEFWIMDKDGNLLKKI